MNDFSSKIILITGASSGIGAATAKAFAKQGACLSITGRNKANLNAVAEECKTLGAKKVLQLFADLGNKHDLERVVKETINEYKQLDVLVNNAGITSMKKAENITTEEFDEVFNINLKAPMILTRLAIPHLEKTKGNIVNMSSMVSQIYCFPALYSTSKAGIDYFTKSSALELTDKGIRVNAISPGTLNTNVFKRCGFSKEEEEKFLTKHAKLHPLGRRLILLSEVTDAILFLASDSAKMITGTILTVDGGRFLFGQ